MWRKLPILWFKSFLMFTEWNIPSGHRTVNLKDYKMPAENSVLVGQLKKMWVGVTNLVLFDDDLLMFFWLKCLEI